MDVSMLSTVIEVKDSSKSNGCELRVNMDSGGVSASLVPSVFRFLLLSLAGAGVWCVEVMLKTRDLALKSLRQ